MPSFIAHVSNQIIWFSLTFLFGRAKVSFTVIILSGILDTPSTYYQNLNHGVVTATQQSSTALYSS